MFVQLFASTILGQGMSYGERSISPPCYVVPSASVQGWRRFAGSSGSFNAEVNKLIGIMIMSCVYI